MSNSTPWANHRILISKFLYDLVFISIIHGDSPLLSYGISRAAEWNSQPEPVTQAMTILGKLDSSQFLSNTGLFTLKHWMGITYRNDCLYNVELMGLNYLYPTFITW